MQARTEITGRYARAYAKASKLEEGEFLDEIAQSPAGARRARADAWWPQPSAHLVTGNRGPGPEPAGTHTTP